VASSQKAIGELGWKPRFGELKTIVSDAWAWRESHPNGYDD
jgi:UDP-glucose 4-epimerase